MVNYCDTFWKLQNLLKEISAAENTLDIKISKTAEQEEKKPAPKVNLDPSDLDAAIAKVDVLISKLKTAKLLINCLNKD